MNTDTGAIKYFKNKAEADAEDGNWEPLQLQGNKKQVDKEMKRIRNLSASIEAGSRYYKQQPISRSTYTPHVGAKQLAKLAKKVL